MPEANNEFREAWNRLTASGASQIKADKMSKVKKPKELEGLNAEDFERWYKDLDIMFQEGGVTEEETQIYLVIGFSYDKFIKDLKRELGVKDSMQGLTARLENILKQFKLIKLNVDEARLRTYVHFSPGEPRAMAKLAAAAQDHHVAPPQSRQCRPPKPNAYPTRVMTIDRREKCLGLGETLQHLDRAAIYLAILMDSWIGLGNDRPPELITTENLLWCELLDMATKHKTAEDALSSFLANTANIHQTTPYPFVLDASQGRTDRPQSNLLLGFLNAEDQNQMIRDTIDKDSAIDLAHPDQDLEEMAAQEARKAVLEKRIADNAEQFYQKSTSRTLDTLPDSNIPSFSSTVRKGTKFYSTNQKWGFTRNSKQATIYQHFAVQQKFIKEFETLAKSCQHTVEPPPDAHSIPTTTSYPKAVGVMHLTHRGYLVLPTSSRHQELQYQILIITAAPVDNRREHDVLIGFCNPSKERPVNGSDTSHIYSEI
ncbi:hypothetical protein VNI00_019034 [Paramarasmius palmivorus]|uniref:Uncharacterized protein n=1 Tax=Paramarasmius palmivorus TaxID=297713 RepID=A0AAW0AS10_9AGAR